MAHTTPWIWRVLVFLVVGSVCVVPSHHAAVASEPTIKVIVNPSVTAQVLTRSDLEAIFKRQEQVWPNNGPVIPFNQEWSSPLRQTFDQSVLGLDIAGSQKYWIDTLVRGGPHPPRTVKSSLLIPQIVSRLPGAIGYVEEGIDTKGTKVVARIRGGQVVAP